MSASAAHAQSAPRSGMCCASTREAVSWRLKPSKSCSRSCAESNPDFSMLLPTCFAAYSRVAAFAEAMSRALPRRRTGFRRARPCAAQVDQCGPTRGSGSHPQTSSARSTGHSSEPCCSLDRTCAGPDIGSCLEPCASVAQAQGRGPIKVLNPLSMNDSQQ